MIRSLLRSWTFRVGGAALIALFVCGVALAALTGTMTVTVTDKAGAPLPGATVKITGSNQIGERAAVTNEKGIVQFNAVTPGSFSVNVTMAGFSPYSHNDVGVKLDTNTQLKVTMAEEQVEAVTVTGKTPTVDTTSTTTGAELPRTMTDSLPIGRDYLTNMSRVPGVGTGSNPSVRGATDRENMFLIDGVNTTDPVTSTFGTNVNFDIIDQQNVTTGGLGAEYGGISGMVSNVITKSGGNNWSGTLSYFREDLDWQADPNPGTPALAQRNAYDYSYTLGGPVLKDRLWHFTSFKKQYSESYQRTDSYGLPMGYFRGGVRYTVTRPPREFDGDLPFAKLTWQATTNHRLQGIFNREETDITSVNANDVTINQEQFYNQTQGGDLYTLKYTGILGSNMVLEGQANFFRNGLDAFPAYPEEGPNYSALIGASYGQQWGRYSNEQYSNRDRDNYKLDLNWFVPTSFGDHNLKFGVDYAKTAFRSINMTSGGESYSEMPSAYRNAYAPTMWHYFANFGASYGDYFPGMFYAWTGLARNNGWACSIGGVDCSELSYFEDVPLDTYYTPGSWLMQIGEGTYSIYDLRFTTRSGRQEASDLNWYRIERSLANRPANDPTGNKAYALYGQDEWRWGKFSARLGVRMDRQQFLGSNGGTTYKFDTMISPRLGVTYDPKGDGKSKIWMNYGVLYDNLNDEVADFVGNTIDQQTQDQVWISAIGDYATYSRSVGGVAQAIVAPNIKNPKTTEYMVGYARDLGNDMSLEFTVFNRNTVNMIEDFDVVSGRPTEFETPTLATLGFTDINGDGAIDRLDLPATQTSQNGVWYVMYNPPGAKRNSFGYDIVLNKRFSNNWQAMASYSFQDTEGNLSTAFLARTVGDDSWMDPRFKHNYGSLGYARRHFIQAMASYTFPFRLTIGGELRAYSGFKYSLNVRDPNYTTSIWNGDPSWIIDALAINRAQFSEALGIPAALPGADGEVGTDDDVDNSAILDRAIVEMMPFELKPGRGAYQDPFFWTTNLRLRYDLPLFKKVQSQFFMDVFNVTDRQAVTTVGATLSRRAALPGNPYGLTPGSTIAITPQTIRDANSYNFQKSLGNQAPRSIQVGVRVQF